VGDWRWWKWGRAYWSFAEYGGYRPGTEKHLLEISPSCCGSCPIPSRKTLQKLGRIGTDLNLSFIFPQALEDRGIIELLFTSDNKDGLKKGVVNGGTC
jgi:hypothetical protein